MIKQCAIRRAVVGGVAAGAFILGGVLAPADRPVVQVVAPCEVDDRCQRAVDRARAQALSTAPVNNGCHEDEAAIVSPDGYLCLAVDDIPRDIMRQARLAE